MSQSAVVESPLAVPAAEGDRSFWASGSVAGTPGPAGPGAIVALVGPDASGKTTVADFLVDWLRTWRGAEKQHLGCPPRTALPTILRLLYLALRRATRGRRRDPGGTSAELLPAFFAVIEALERAAAARCCARLAEHGVVLVADRYPTRVVGAANGPRTAHGHASRVVRWLARVERRLYETVRDPDLVIRLDVPEEEAVRRNAARRDPKPDEMVRRSHAAAMRIQFPNVPRLVVDNTRPLAEVEWEIAAFVGATLAELGRAAHGSAPALADVARA